MLVGKADIELTGIEATDLDGHLDNAKQLPAHQAPYRQAGTVVQQLVGASVQPNEMICPELIIKVLMDRLVQWSDSWGARVEKNEMVCPELEYVSLYSQVCKYVSVVIVFTIYSFRILSLSLLNICIFLLSIP